MLNYLFRSIGIASAEPEQLPVNPSNDLLVVSDKDHEDDICEITVRPMTYSEVAGNGIKGRVVVSSRNPAASAPASDEYMPAIETYPSPPATRTSAFEAHELYGEFEEAIGAKLGDRTKRRRKSHGAKNRKHVNA